MPAPGPYGVLSARTAANHRPRRQRRPKGLRGFKKMFRSILLLLILTIVTMGSIKAYKVFHSRVSLLPSVAAPDFEAAMAPATNAGSSLPPAPNSGSETAAGSSAVQDKSGGALVLVNRTHPLPASYVPANLVAVKARLAQDITPDERLMQPEAAAALENLLRKADQSSITLYCVSGYRSFATQEALYAWRVNSEGQTSADLYTAHPGQSEHQTGLAMDLTNRAGVQGDLVGDFGQTAEGIWLANNAHNFGFILRYPQGKENITGYSYEPWHIRYVGVADARAMHAKGLVLEEYSK